MLADGKARLVDIREPDEWADVRLPDAEAAPLSVLPWMQIAPASAEKSIIFTCHSSRRTTANSALLESKAKGPAWQIEGGVQNWLQQGLPAIKSKKPIPIMRQVQIAAGSLVLAGLAGSLVQPAMIWLSAFVGAGLLFAGISGTCALGSLLAAMPWNKK